MARLKRRIDFSREIAVLPHATWPLCKRSTALKEMQNVFSALNIYLWIHGIGFTTKFGPSRSNSILTVVSVILILICDGGTVGIIQEVTVRAYKQSKAISKQQITKIIIWLGIILLRFFMCYQRKKIILLIRKLAKVCSAFNSGNPLKFQIKLSVILIVYDMCIIASAFLLIFTYASVISKNSFPFGAIPPPYSIYFLYCSIFFSQWSDINMAVTAHFCCMCIFLKKGLVEIKNKVCQRKVKSNEIEDLFQEYIEITNIIQEINSNFHTVLILSVSITLITVFHATYWLVFGKPVSNYHTAFSFLIIAISLPRFFILCMFSSSVKQIATEVRNEVQIQLTESDDWKSLKYVIKILDQSVVFTFLDSIVIDKSLILSTLGSFLTYGILIATFTMNTDKKN